MKSAFEVLVLILLLPSSLVSLSSQDQPRFDISVGGNETVQQGGHAYLTCTIVNVGNKSVSWVRMRDSHILTVDGETFISDDRFVSLHKPGTSIWTLQIKYVTASDAGRYECQLSTETKMSQIVELAVVVPKIRIFGDPDIYVKAGSNVQLKCVISQVIPPLDLVHIYSHDWLS